MPWKQLRNICHLRYSSALPRLICAVCLHSAKWNGMRLAFTCWHGMLCWTLCAMNVGFKCLLGLTIARLRRDLKPTFSKVHVQGFRKVAANSAVCLGSHTDGNQTPACTCYAVPTYNVTSGFCDKSVCQQTDSTLIECLVQTCKGPAKIAVAMMCTCMAGWRLLTDCYRLSCNLC